MSPQKRGARLRARTIGKAFAYVGMGARSLPCAAFSPAAERPLMVALVEREVSTLPMAIGHTPPRSMNNDEHTEAPPPRVSAGS